MFNFEVLNLEVDYKEAEQKLLELQPWSPHLGTVMKIRIKNALLKSNSELTP